MNILLLSTIYPLPSKENKGTSVCHYFTKEWAKEGHNVRVVHYQAVYPFFYYWAARVARDLITAKTGAVVYTKRDKGAQYEWDGVQVLRIPLFKPIPHGRFLSISIRKSIQQIVNSNAEADFIPDIIVGHFPNPQIEVVAKLKSIYSSATTAIIMHENFDLDGVYGERFKCFIIKLICGDSVQRNIEKISKRDMVSLSILLSVIQVFPQVILQKAILIHLRNH